MLRGDRNSEIIKRGLTEFMEVNLLRFKKQLPRL